MSNAAQTFAVPAHVPRELIRDIDPWADIESAGAEGHARAAQYHTEFPPVFYATSLGYRPGCWVPRRAEDMRRILQDAETFSSDRQVGFSMLMGESWPLIPLEIDPPNHAAYRMLINPLFSPKRVAELDADMRVLARSLIKGVLADGGCDFHTAFAAKFPILIFLKLMGWPIEEAPRFVEWVHTLVKSKDPVVIGATAREIATYLRGRIAERRAAPTDDFTSYVVAAEIDGRKLTEDEVLGICFLIFIAGLDTVTSALAFQFHHLAKHQADQARLRAEPALIPAAVEELLRAYSTVNLLRAVVRDVEVGGAPMRAGDSVLISTELANLDPEEFADPLKVDFERENNRHMAFASGVHRCVGSHLARQELTIAVQEWLALAPPFSLDQPEKIVMRVGGVFGLDNVRLRWNEAAAA